MRYLKFVCTTLLLILNTSGAYAGIIASSTFDAGLDGWTAVACAGSSCSGLTPSSGVFGWSSSGGNPGGYADFQDGPEATTVLALAPGAYLGNLSGLDGVGQLSFDYLNLGPGNRALSVSLFSVGGVDEARFDFIAPEVGDGWQTFAVDIEEAAWTIVAGNWTSLLANVGALIIPVDKFGGGFVGGDHNGLDNVTLSVPEPTSLGLLSLGLVVLSLRKRTLS